MLNLRYVFMANKIVYLQMITESDFRLNSKIIRFYMFLSELFPFSVGKKVPFHAKFKVSPYSVQNCLY
jgi:hypothetical protein